MIRRSRPASLLPLLACVCLTAPSARAQETTESLELRMPTADDRAAAERAPLFASHEPLELTLRTDVDHIKNDRSEDFEEQPGELDWRTPDGAGGRLDVQVRTRGNFRLERRNCSFPPLRLNVRTSQAEGTPFEGEDKLKLVTPCNERRGNYQDYVLKEYLAYRIFNELTPWSFRVRLARVTYEDTADEQDTRTLLAFLIEDEERLAHRLGGVVREFDQLHPLATDARYSTLVALFQLLIGNTDWSPVAFHNVIAVRDGEGRYLTVPYDFDFSGMVDARYALPDPQLGIKDVRERIYRGFCRKDVDAAAVAVEMLERRQAIEAMVAGFDHLDEGERRDIERYLEPFWRMLENPGRFQREVERGCRSLG